MHLYNNVIYSCYCDHAMGTVYMDVLDVLTCMYDIGDLMSAPTELDLSFDDGSNSSPVTSSLTITGSHTVLIEKFPRS